MTDNNLSADPFFGENIEQQPIREDDEQYHKAKAFYDCLQNCNKKLVYKDSKHWYVQIDG